MPRKNAKETHRIESDNVIPAFSTGEVKVDERYLNVKNERLNSDQFSREEEEMIANIQNYSSNDKIIPRRVPKFFIENSESSGEEANGVDNHKEREAQIWDAFMSKFQNLPQKSKDDQFEDKADGARSVKHARISMMNPQFETSRNAKKAFRQRLGSVGIDTYSHKLKELKHKKDVTSDEYPIYGNSVQRNINKYSGTIEMQVNITKLISVNCELQNFNAEIIIYTYWFDKYLQSAGIHQNANLNNETLKKCWIPLTKISNACDDVQLLSRYFMFDNSRNYHLIQSERYRGTFSSPMDFTHAPFDTQRLSLWICLENCSLEEARMVDCRYQMHRILQQTTAIRRIYCTYQIVEASILSRAQQATLGVSSPPVRIISCYITRLPKYIIVSNAIFYISVLSLSIIPVANFTLSAYDNVHLLQQLLINTIIHRYCRKDPLSKNSFNIIELYASIVTAYLLVLLIITTLLLNNDSPDDKSYAIVLALQLLFILILHLVFSLYIYFVPLKIQREMFKRESEYLKILEDMNLEDEPDSNLQNSTRKSAASILMSRFSVDSSLNPNM